MERLNGWPVYSATPKGIDPVTRLVYLHGGAYVFQMAQGDWALVDECARMIPATGAVPIYPLAPGRTADTTVVETADVLAALMDEAGDENTVLMGTSCGGSLTLAAAQLLRDRGRVPARLILISPGPLDGTVSDPRQVKLEAGDKMLTRTGVAAAARLYAGSLHVRDPRVSPLFGDMRGLPPMTVLASNSELLYPDSMRLAEKAQQAGVPVDLHVADGLPHAYPVLAGTPESKHAITTIADAARSATQRTPAG